MRYFVWKWKLLSHVQLFATPWDYTVHGTLQARIPEWIAIPFSRGSSQPRDQTRSPSLQGDSLPAEPPGKPKNTGVGSLSLLQQIFPTQESNQCLFHCRWILYQQSYQGSPGKPPKSMLLAHFPALLSYFVWCTGLTQVWIKMPPLISFLFFLKPWSF